MFRTFLLASGDQPAPAEFASGIERVAQLYGSRLVRAVVRGAQDLAAALEGSVAGGEPVPPAELRPGAFVVQDVLLVGDLISALCDKGHEADVIVVWHETLAGGDGQPSSDLTSELVRQAPRPVWLGREPTRFPEQILVAYDGSAQAGRALHMGANLAETLGARLTVLNVDESRDVVAQDLILRRAAGYCEPYRITMERVGVFGSAPAAIRSYAEAHASDLVVLGATGVGYLRGLLFGSVAGQLITTAPCSVLVAK
jgi:nucleotide-binding universal stress UspA family protein